MIYERFELFRDDQATNRDSCVLLYALVASTRPKIVVETGTHLGLSACYIAQALKDNDWGHLYTYDVKDWGATKNISQFDLGEYVTCKVKGGDEVIEENIDFAYLDSDHSKEFVIKEFMNILPKLSPHAIVVWDNASEENQRIWNFGVRSGIEELGIQVAYIPVPNGMMIYTHGGLKSKNTPDMR